MGELIRQPDEWYGPPGEPPVPWVVWRPAEPLVAAVPALERLRHDLARAPFAPPPDAPAWPPASAALVTAAFRALTRWLQAGGSPRQQAWLAHQAAAVPVDGWRVPCLDEAVALAAGREAWSWLTGRLAEAVAIGGGAADPWSGLSAVRARVKQLGPHDGPAVVLLRALARGVPVRRLAADMPVYRLGQGRHQHRLFNGFTERTGHIATVAATLKHVTHDLLRGAGLPVARQERVSDWAGARRAAAVIGYPLVVKPASTDYGTAVSTGITDEAGLRQAFDAARAHGALLVESQLPGADHRLVVLNGRLVGAVRRDPAAVTGDGRSDVATLMAALAARRAADPILAGFASARPDDPLVQQTLRRQGLTPASVPAAGQVVQLRSNANLSTGGSMTVVTDQVHPDNVRMAERAARCLGLDHAGIDFLTPDIGQPWHALACGICEVNPTPALLTPGIEDLLLDALLPGGADGRVPVVVVVGEGPAAQADAAVVADWAAARGRVAGMVAGGRVLLDGLPACREPRPPAAQLDLLLADDTLDLAVVQAGADTLLAQGLRVPACDLVVWRCGAAAREAVLASPRTVLARTTAVLLEPDAARLRAALDLRLGARLAGPAPWAR